MPSAKSVIHSRHCCNHLPMPTSFDFVEFSCCLPEVYCAEDVVELSPPLLWKAIHVSPFLHIFCNLTLWKHVGVICKSFHWVILETMYQYGIEITWYLHWNSHVSAAEYASLYDNKTCKCCAWWPWFINKRCSNQFGSKVFGSNYYPSILLQCFFILTHQTNPLGWPILIT